MRQHKIHVANRNCAESQLMASPFRAVFHDIDSICKRHRKNISDAADRIVVDILNELFPSIDCQPRRRCPVPGNGIDTQIEFCLDDYNRWIPGSNESNGIPARADVCGLVWHQRWKRIHLASIGVEI